MPKYFPDGKPTSWEQNSPRNTSRINKLAPHDLAGHIVAPTHVIVADDGKKWIRVSTVNFLAVNLYTFANWYFKITKRIPDRLNCIHILPIAPNDNANLRPLEKHDRIFRFTTDEKFLDQLSYLSSDNSFLIPWDKLKPVLSISNTGNFPWFDQTIMELVLKILSDQDIIAKSAKNKYWAIPKKYRSFVKKRAYKLKVFFKGLKL